LTQETVIAAGVPALDFEVTGAEAVRHAAAPTVGFGLRLTSDRPVRSGMLTAQIRIAAPARPYDPETQARLGDLFGDPADWGRTLRSLLWTHAVFLVPPFQHSTTVKLEVPCTYDFEVASAKYLHALREGDVPLELMFSGSVFYEDDGRLRAARVSWESEAQFHMPIQVWQDAMEAHFPGSAWVRMRRDVFDRLVDYRTRRSLPTWESVFEELLGG
jgi:Family of unknown function (DUF6084)